MHGNQAECIVERPGGDTNTPNGYYPLANCIWSWDFAHATTFSGVKYYPGSTNTGTLNVSMTDDSGKNVISWPRIDTGLPNLFVQDQGCGFNGGCTP